MRMTNVSDKHFLWHNLNGYAVLYAERIFACIKRTPFFSPKKKKKKYFFLVFSSFNWLVLVVELK